MEKMIMRTAVILSGLVLLASCGEATQATKTTKATKATHSDNVISRGEAYAMSDVVVPGKVVLLEFTATW